MLFNIKNFLFFLIYLASNTLFANTLTFDISQKNISVSENSNEPDFTIYGFSDSKKTLVLKVMGPKQKVVLQKKKKIFGMWTWNKTGEFSYPGLFHYYTNNRNNEIEFDIKKDLVDNIRLIGKDDDNLKKELIEKKLSISLFMIKNNSFQVINNSVPKFFKIPVKLPKNCPSGEYFVSMSLIDKGNKFETKKIKISVEKPGLSSFIFKFAHKFSFIYGIFSAIIAIGLGIIAGFIFKKS